MAQLNRLRSQRLPSAASVGAALGTLALVACPDPSARFDEFLDRTEEDRPQGDDSAEGETGETGDGDTGGIDGLDDMSGIYLFALETALGPDTPLQFVTTVDMVVAEDGQSATADFTFQPLSLEVGQTTMPREFVGDPIVYTDIAFDAGGNFEIDMGEVMVTGAANPVTGSDILATLVVDGEVVHASAMCGEITGDLTMPLEYDLAGSTFGAIKLMDDGSDPGTLPLEFPYRCEQVPPPDPTLPNLSGTFLFALETALGPDTPLQFVTTIDFSYAADGAGGTADITFQPLSLDVGQTTAPREFVGETITYNDIAVDADGNFMIDMGEVMVTGAANPITGSDIVATLVVEGGMVHIDALCGEITGDLTMPLEYDLAGSTFGAIRLADDGSNPATLPTEFPYKCDQVPPEGG